MKNVRRVFAMLARSGLSIAWLTAAFAVCHTALAAQTPSVHAPAEDARNTGVRNTDSRLPLPQFTARTAWEQRRRFLRNQVLVSAGLLPMPEKTPLHAQIFGKIEGQDYSIEKVLIETWPGFYLGGNLYRPRNGKATHPGVLNPHGHWPYGRLENEPLYSGPSFGISMARQGYVVFAYDMIGYTDTVQVPHHFGSAEQRLWSFGPLGLQLWDSIRALDFLASLDDVDPNRLGIAGASGGATQAFLLTAVDDRVQFAAPVNMVSAIMQGGDLCENAPGLRIDTSNVELAALFAPKPMLLVSTTRDWTRNVPKEEFPAIQRIYSLYGKSDQVDVVQIDAEHNFNQQSREAVYRFFAKVNPGLSDPRELAEHDISVPHIQDLLALSNRALPAGALDVDGLFRSWQLSAQAQNAHMDAASLRERLRSTLAVETPRDVLADLDGPSIVLSRAGTGDRVPGIWIPGSGRVAIVVNERGSAAALQSPLTARLRREGRPLLLLDVFQTGAAKAPRKGDPAAGINPNLPTNADEEDKADAAAGGAKFYTFNVADDAARVQDVVTAIAYAHQKTGAAVDIYAEGDAAVWAVFAAAVSEAPVALHVDKLPQLSSDADYVAHFNVPGILRAGGLPVAQKLANTR